MIEKYNIIKEFGRHINYAIEKYEDKFDATLLNLKTNETITLTDYQKFSSANFLLEKFKSMLLFWETGFGKTIECVYLIKNLFIVYPQWKIFLFVKSSLGNDPWRKTINLYLPKNIQNNIFMIHYDLINIEQLFLMKHSSISSDERIFYIFDESHDFIKKIIPKENQPERRLTKIMKPLIHGINKPYNKILFMSATPINDTFLEFTYMMHFLRNGNLKINEKLFDNKQILLESDLLKKTCIGLISYKRRSDIDIFKNIDGTDILAGKKIYFIELLMSNTQSSMYKTVSQIELKSKSRGFRTLRKMVNTFAFHDIKIKKDLEDDEYIKLLKEKINSFNNLMKSINFSDEFLNDFSEENIIVSDDTSMAQNLNFRINTQLKFSSSLDMDKNKKQQEISKLRILHSYSSKYIKTCQIIKQSKGKCLVYQPFVSFEGVRTLLSYFDKFKITYIEYTQKTKNSRFELVQNFNNKNNIYGQKIKCCVFSSAGTEGISLLNVRDLIIMDLPWSGSNLEQIFGRAIRLNSHADLPLKDRIVSIYILLNKTNNTDNISIDYEILNIIKEKEKQKKQLLSVMIDGSIETIHALYPDVESIEKENFYSLVNNKYDLNEYKKQNISVLRKLILIHYTFNIDSTEYFEGYLDEDRNQIFLGSSLVGNLVFNEYENKIFKIIDQKLVYLAIAI